MILLYAWSSAVTKSRYEQVRNAYRIQVTATFRNIIERGRNVCSWWNVFRWPANRHHSRPFIQTCNLGRAGEDLPSRRHVAWSVRLARCLSRDWKVPTEWALFSQGGSRWHASLSQVPGATDAVDTTKKRIFFWLSVPAESIYTYAYYQLPGFLSYSSGLLEKILNFIGKMSNVSFIVFVTLCAVFCLSVVSYVDFCVLCLIVVPLPQGKN
jgi:hypothetical protein